MLRLANNRCALLFVSIAVAAVISACSGDKKREVVEGERIGIITTEGDIQVDPVLASVPVTLPRPYVNPNWGQDGGNPQNLEHHLALPDTLSVAWKSSIGKGSGKYERLVSGPVVWGNSVYTIDIKATVSAFNTANGDLRWRTELKQEGEKDNVAFGGGVAYWGGKVFASTGYGFIVALDAASGAELWRNEIGVPLRSAPTVSGGQVYVATQDSRMVAISADTGETLWEHYAIVENAEVLGASSPAVEGDTIIAGFSSGELYALRAQNGQVNWQDALSRTGKLTALATLNDINGNPVIYNGRVYVGNHSGRLTAVDFRTGERVWEVNIGTLYTPWVAGDYIYVVSNDGEVVALSIRDGRVRWVQQLERFEKRKKRKDLVRWAGPVLAGDRLFVVSSHGYVVALSPYTGEIVSGEHVDDSLSITPVVANNTLYILTDDGHLIAYR